MRDANTGYTPLYCVGRNTRLTKVAGYVSPSRIGNVDRIGPRMNEGNSPILGRRAGKPFSLSKTVCAEHWLGKRRLPISALLDADAGPNPGGPIRHVRDEENDFHSDDDLF